MSYIKIHKENRVGYITMSRPEKRNALHPDMVSEISNALDSFEKDQEVKVLILQGEGNTFCAGADLDYLKQLQDFSYEENLEDSKRLKEMFLKIYSLQKPVIAKIEGHAIAGGCGLATVCDFSISVPDAKFGYTESRIGFVPALVMVFLLRKIGEGRARELLLTGKLITADQAAEYGLINEVVPSENLDAVVEKLANDLITKTSGESLKMIKQMISGVQDLTVEDALTYASEMNARARETEDCKKGIASFLDKSKVSW